MGGPANVGLERLNKVLANAGVASRRGADELIRGRRVTVNGRTVTAMGTQVDLAVDDVRLDGEPIPQPRRKVCLALNKPRHVITSASDPLGRTTVIDMLRDQPRLFPVGRLDAASEGLLLLTNDGDLAHRLTHPRYGHEKEYRVKISGTPTDETMRLWREGMYLEDGRTRPAEVRVESSTGAGTWLRFVLREGRNRQIRRMVEAMHHTVHRLVRVRIGPITLGDLGPGEYRELSASDVARLLRGEDPAQESDRARKDPGTRTKRKGWARAKPKPTRPGKGRRSRPTRGRGRRGSSRR